MFRRGKEHAGDSASSISAVQEFLAAHKEVDVICLVQVEIFLFLSKISILLSSALHPSYSQTS